MRRVESGDAVRSHDMSESEYPLKKASTLHSLTKCSVSVHLLLGVNHMPFDSVLARSTLSRNSPSEHVRVAILRKHFVGSLIGLPHGQLLNTCCCCTTSYNNSISSLRLVVLLVVLDALPWCSRRVSQLRCLYCKMRKTRYNPPATTRVAVGPLTPSVTANRTRSPTATLLVLTREPKWQNTYVVASQSGTM
jgi:hypothetical protein